MNAPERILLPDVWSSVDPRQAASQRVAIKGVRYPIRLRSDDGAVVATIVTADRSVGRPLQAQGTRGSRFVGLVETNRPPLTIAGLEKVRGGMHAHIGGNSRCIERRLPDLRSNKALIGNVENLDVKLSAANSQDAGIAIALSVTVPVTSLCFCSRKCPDYDAHNRPCQIAIGAEPRGCVSIEQLVRIGEDEASYEPYGLPKRPDENFVTERAYDNPKFVGNPVPVSALKQNNDPRTARYVVDAENFGLISNHSDYARLEGGDADDEQARVARAAAHTGDAPGDHKETMWE